MPLELGLDLGCKRYGQRYQQAKVLLILDIEQHRYQRCISDIAGQDVAAHSNRVRDVIDLVREWLRPELDPQVVIIPSGYEIRQRAFHSYSRAPAEIRSWTTEL
jgi:hypothetical protein